MRKLFSYGKKVPNLFDVLNYSVTGSTPGRVNITQLYFNSVNSEEKGLKRTSGAFKIN